MRKNLLPLLVSGFVFLSIFSSCSKEQQENAQPATISTSTSSTLKATATLTEGFENASKTAYAAASVNLSTGSWNFDDALIGTSSTDRKNGSNSVRIRNTG